MNDERTTGFKDYELAEIRVGRPTDDKADFPAEMHLPSLGTHDQGELSRSDLEPLRDPRLEADIEAYGEKLGRALFAEGALGPAIRHALAFSQGSGKGLRVRLWLPGADEKPQEETGGSADRRDSLSLSEIHWERIFLPDNGDWRPLGTWGDTPFSRYVPSQRAKALVRQYERPLRMLAVISAAENLPRWNLDPINPEESRALHAALDKGPRKQDMTVTYLETGTETPPTLDQLETTLSRGYHLVHFLCHGAVTEGGTAIYLEDEGGEVQKVTMKKLLKVFKRIPRSPSFCFLAACETAARWETSGFLPLAPALVAQGSIEATVAMTRRVGMPTARLFTEQFYDRLLDHCMVDLAVNEARARVEDRWDWDVPALFMRNPAHALFDLGAPRAASADTTYSDRYIGAVVVRLDELEEALQRGVTVPYEDHFAILRDLFVHRNTFRESVRDCYDGNWADRFCAAFETHEMMAAYWPILQKRGKEPAHDHWLRSYQNAESSVRRYVQAMTRLFDPPLTVDLDGGLCPGDRQDLRDRELPKEDIPDETVEECEKPRQELLEEIDPWPLRLRYA